MLDWLQEFKHGLVDESVPEIETTQWIQSYPCKSKTSQETQKSLQKFLEPIRKPKVIYTDNFLDFGKACELGIIVRQRRTYRKRMGLLKEQCAE